MQATRHPRLGLFLAVLCVVLAAFFESYLPYHFAEANKPPTATFLGQVGHTTDQNMYFSFIRQAYDGNIVFNNRLTATPNSGAFVNLQFLAVGRAMRVFHLSENAVYQVWRFAGVFFLAFGFTLLSLVALPSLSKRLAALCVFIFGGGFGAFFWFAGAHDLLSRETTFKLTPDLWTGLIPFQQLMLNPHFSLPHGLLLIGFALFLLAEMRDQSVWLYVASGAIFLVSGFVRPYDLISLAVVIPVFVVSEAIRHFDWRASALRVIPLAMALPALVYSIWLFEYHPIFKYWSQQGHNIQFMPSPHVQMFAYGSIGLLAMARILQFRSNPLSLIERFLLVWFVGIFFCVHLGSIIPALGFSPQNSIPLFAPLVLFAFSLRLKLRGFRRGLFMAAVATLLVISNIGGVAYSSQPFTGTADTHNYYATADEVAALGWLDKKLRPGTVVLAVPPVAGRISKYTSASSLVGHHSVTPHYNSILTRVRRLLAARQFTPSEHGTLRELGADYLFVGPQEQLLLGFDPNAAPGLARIFVQGSVAIYRVASAME
ncbi:MAG: hypothetical protein WCG85_03105 [Polyangia bacterium]